MCEQRVDGQTAKEYVHDVHRIMELNDEHRKYGRKGIYLTHGVSALDAMDRIAVLDKVRGFDAFTKDNDPYMEHDFGEVVHKGTRFFWKIDYYDKTNTYRSENPGDPSVTNRVLIVMLASEY